MMRKIRPDYLAICARSAQNEGISYGQYMARRYNPAPLPAPAAMEEAAEPVPEPKRGENQCPHCGRIFYTTNPRQKYCCYECQYERNKKLGNQRLRERRKQAPAEKKAPAEKRARFCVICGGAIPMSRAAHAITCSAECGKERRYQLNREKMHRLRQERKAARDAEREGVFSGDTEHRPAD